MEADILKVFRLDPLIKDTKGKYFIAYIKHRMLRHHVQSISRDTVNIAGEIALLNSHY